MLGKHGRRLVGLAPCASVISLAVVLRIGAPALAHGGGLMLPDAGSQAMQRAGAFVARADDPTALYHNPAGLAKLTGTHVVFSANLVDLSLEYQRSGEYEQGLRRRGYEGQPYPAVRDDSTPAIGIGGFASIPFLAVSTDLRAALPLRVAAGLFAPMGYPDRRFPDGHRLGGSDAIAPGPQRYDVISQQAAIVLPSLALGYRLYPNVDFGARFSWGFGSLTARSALWGLRNDEESPGKDGLFEVEVSDGFIPAFGAGILIRPAPWIELGLAWTSRVTLEGQGTGRAELGDELGVPGTPELIVPVDDADARCARGGTATALKACVKVPLPQTVTAGARFILRDGEAERLDVEVDLRWENWSAASDFEVLVDGESNLTGLPLHPVSVRHGFQDVLSARLGASYAVPAGSVRLLLRGGLAHDTAAAPASWTRLDIDGASRTLVAFGLGLEIGRIRFDAGAGVVLEPDRIVDVCNPTLDAPGCTGNGRDTAPRDRTAPDPLQPLGAAETRVESPFNGGRYSSRYTLFSGGITAWF